MFGDRSMIKSDVLKIPKSLVYQDKVSRVQAMMLNDEIFVFFFMSVDYDRNIFSESEQIKQNISSDQCVVRNDDKNFGMMIKTLETLS